MKVLSACRRSHTEDRYKKTVVYMWPKGETILENLANRRNRPIEQMRALLPEVLRLSGISTAIAESAKWRQSAGCKCGCSPGFIIDFHSYDSIHADIADDNYVPYVADTDVVDAMAAG